MSDYLWHYENKENEKSKVEVARDFNISYVPEEKLSDDTFPNEVKITFSHSDRKYHAVFVRMLKGHHSYPVSGTDIFVLDDEGQSAKLHSTHDNKKASLSQTIFLSLDLLNL